LPGEGRSGGEGRFRVVGVETLQHLGQVVSREAPIERARRVVVAVLEAAETIRQCSEVGEVSGLDDFALDDREHDLDLVQP